jgi:hypothetical protein
VTVEASFLKEQGYFARTGTHSEGARWGIGARIKLSDSGKIPNRELAKFTNNKLDHLNYS